MCIIAVVLDVVYDTLAPMVSECMILGLFVFVCILAPLRLCWMWYIITLAPMVSACVIYTSCCLFVCLFFVCLCFLCVLRGIAGPDGECVCDLGILLFVFVCLC